eukprot:RCo046588
MFSNKMKHKVVGGGKYQLGKTLGKGNFSKVKLATNTQTGEQVAVKITERDQMTDPGTETQLRREIAVLRKLHHPNVVRLLDAFTTPKTYFIVLELVTGGDLLDKIASLHHPMDESLARHYFQQLILGLYFVHKNGIAHRDLKPENLMLDANGNLKISDFGLCKQCNIGNGQFDSSRAMCGTPEYLAPEVFQQRGYNGFQSDIWSCGVILYVLCGRRLPFGHRGKDSQAKIQNATFEMKKHFSPELRDLLSHMLVANPNRRYTLEDIVRHPWMQPMPEAELEYVRQFNPDMATAAEMDEAIEPVAEEIQGAPERGQAPEWGPQSQQQFQAPHHGMAAPSFSNWNAPRGGGSISPTPSFGSPFAVPPSLIAPPCVLAMPGQKPVRIPTAPGSFLAPQQFSVRPVTPAMERGGCHTGYVGGSSFSRPVYYSNTGFQQPSGAPQPRSVSPAPPAEWWGRMPTPVAWYSPCP